MYKKTSASHLLAGRQNAEVHWIKKNFQLGAAIAYMQPQSFLVNILFQRCADSARACHQFLKVAD
ncbi:MAG: hypothetical protein Q4D42_10100, partial [Eubacteriales bacterium]|nr:hypothetical protein [Eubacteriales bacterium]